MSNRLIRQLKKKFDQKDKNIFCNKGNISGNY